MPKEETNMNTLKQSLKRLIPVWLGKKSEEPIKKCWACIIKVINTIVRIVNIVFGKC